MKTTTIEVSWNDFADLVNGYVDRQKKNFSRPSKGDTRRQKVVKAWRTVQDCR